MCWDGAHAPWKLDDNRVWCAMVETCRVSVMTVGWGSVWGSVRPAGVRAFAGGDRGGSGGGGGGGRAASWPRINVEL